MESNFWKHAVEKTVSWKWNELLLWLLVSFFIFLVHFNPLVMAQTAWAGLGDESSYLAHALTIGLDFDLNYSNEPLVPAGINALTGLPPHPIGTGVVLAPFVFLFSLIDRLVGHPIIANHKDFVGSWVMVGILVAKLTSLFSSIYFYTAAVNILRRDRVLGNVAGVLIAFGAGLGYWALGNPLKPHIFEFALYSVALYLFAKYWWVDAKFGRANWFLVGIYSILILLIIIRPSNLIALIFPFAWSIFMVKGSGEKISVLILRNALYVLGAVIAIALINKMVYGHLMRRT